MMQLKLSFTRPYLDVRPHESGLTFLLQEKMRSLFFDTVLHRILGLDQMRYLRQVQPRFRGF